MTDPRFTDPRLSDPVLRRDEAVGGIWGWIAGLAVLALIGFIVIAGWNNSGTTASNNSSPIITGSAPRNVTPPSTTGSGSMSPMMSPSVRPSPLAPAPADSGKQ
jgi:hypothetical protein